MASSSPDDAKRAQLVTHMLETLQDESQVTKRLTTWEESFIEDMAERWRPGANVTDKQFECIERIYAEKTK